LNTCPRFCTNVFVFFFGAARAAAGAIDRQLCLAGRGMKTERCARVEFASKVQQGAGSEGIDRSSPPPGLR
jgi:hypothetical protein